MTTSSAYTTRLREGLVASLLVTGVVAAGCATYPERIDELEQARMAVDALEDTPEAHQIAAAQIQDANRYLSRAEAAYEDEEDVDLVTHLAYVARRHAEIGQQLLRNDQLQDEIARAEDTKNQVLLEARARDAEQAQAEALVRRAEAEQAQEEAATQRAEAERLQQELAALEAKQTQRGMVLTLGDVLFDTDEAQLRTGATDTVSRLAEFMREYPERELLIEGHTDATGPDAYNEELSARRASAVRDALVSQGIEPQRIRTVGLGEQFPVASNEDSSGRQQNRRVEIVISDENGDFPQAARRG